MNPVNLWLTKEGKNNNFHLWECCLKWGCQRCDLAKCLAQLHQCYQQRVNPREPDYRDQEPQEMASQWMLSLGRQSWLGWTLLSWTLGFKKKIRQIKGEIIRPRCHFEEAQLPSSKNSAASTAFSVMSDVGLSSSNSVSSLSVSRRAGGKWRR